MSYVFGDGFDCYAAAADAVAGYWDGGSLAGLSLQAGRFAGSQCLRMTGSGNSNYYKNSGSNDAVHHILLAYRISSLGGGTTFQGGFTLSDAGTAQCSVGFRSDGALILTTGASNGATVATWAGAVTGTNTWIAYEIEIVIHNTAGSITVRRNGSTSNDFQQTNVNTRGGTTNAWANRLQLLTGAGQAANNDVDDILWRSDASSVPWVGDIRCYTRMPASDVQKQFTPSTGTTNYTCVDEAQQNAATDYVSDSNVGDADLYGIAALGVTPQSVVAVTTRGFIQKSDAGTRNGAVQLKSGAPTVQSPSTALSTSWGWLFRTDVTDPATGAAWTPTAVNNVSIGPCVTA